MKNYISFKDVSFWYQKENLKALDGITINFEKGKFICILGHNGSGKSTLSKLLIGLIKPSKGAIIVDGIEMSKQTLKEIRKKIGIVFQNPDNQFIASSAADDIAFGLSNRQIASEKMDEIIDDVAKKVNIKHLLNKAPENLSGGQKQRVAIASQLALSPDVIIFDEATSMLDPKGRQEVVNIMKELRTKDKKTVIAITHFMDEAIYADYVIVLKDGKLLIQGTPEEIFKQTNKLKETRLKLPFIYDLSLKLNAKNKKIKPTFKEEELLKQLRN